ncbi:MAG: bifunctional 4-hydroxy-2-oxoglutarate aldolase/2-dehydro-3-deoxy-phosphogluconate aldolase [Bifidobacterium sp.]|jgi:2-dehydro-3-deoxyphosphogluconate aldolase/(4S)-4-hydroxy-2-oxoglutarate aldolase|nr:bifunctional 4-hydroxy-2-oxoglutarate aldolase/2-dehydro-3-deoxy-phosphogluconate aldolase [Bifidobacterium sp.]MCI1865008.1 bifunctional 4-hydroxy-2-oxoglutarate aldolase/2-dehydro-3-deoxy-phosphogluconate aldolase [Bifidobacterium sp.]
MPNTTYKIQAIETIVNTGVLVIVRLDDHDEALNVCEAAIAGGIKALEITLSTPGAFDIINTLATKYADKDVVVGAGTALDPAAAYKAIGSGARMLISPNLNPEMIRTANRYQAVSITGAMTPTEIVNTLEAGTDIVKLFPTNVTNMEYVKAVSSPLPWAPLMPSGGVTADNAEQWIKAGSLILGVGSYITKAAKIDGDYSRVTESARQMLFAVKKARAAR